jgi:hypothetical protein
MLVEITFGIGQILMRNGSERKASLYQSANQVCAILKQS